jgi:hypothetical protein
MWDEAMYCGYGSGGRGPGDGGGNGEFVATINSVCLPYFEDEGGCWDGLSGYKLYSYSG